MGCSKLFTESKNIVSIRRYRDYHMLTLRKLAISPIILKCQFLTLKANISANIYPNTLKLHRVTQWHDTKKFDAQFFFSLLAGRPADNYVLFFEKFEKKHIIVSRSARRKRKKKLSTRFFCMDPLSIPAKFQDIWMKIVGVIKF